MRLKRRLLPSRLRRTGAPYKKHCWVAVYLPLVDGVERTGIWENYDLDTKAGRARFKLISDAYAGRL